MLVLKDRNKQIPNGLKFYVPETKWQPMAYSSLSSIVQQLINHRNANPFLRDKNQWSTDPDVVAAEVDNYNAQLCKAMGWNDYITDGGAYLPKSPAPTQSSLSRLAAVAGRVKELWKGYNAIEEFRNAHTPPVDPLVSQRRAEICATCPMNEKGDWTRWFTVPYAEKIRRDLEDDFWKKLKTTKDDVLQVCGPCLCPLRLKVHVPIFYILPTLGPELTDKLRKAPHCWILDEKEALT